MSIPATTRSLEEIRQQLLSDALDQVYRLQDPTLAMTKRVLADAAMAICYRDMTIRLLRVGSIPWAHEALHYLNETQPIPTQSISSQPAQAQPTPPQSISPQPSLNHPTPIKPNPSQPLLLSVTNPIGTT